jgi:hypothetical protein
VDGDGRRDAAGAEEGGVKWLNYAVLAVASQNFTTVTVMCITVCIDGRAATYPEQGAFANRRC